MNGRRGLGNKNPRQYLTISEAPRILEMLFCGGHRILFEGLPFLRCTRKIPGLLIELKPFRHGAIEGCSLPRELVSIG
jgi:hypothetical protein